MLASMALGLAILGASAAGLGGYVQATAPQRAAGERQALADRIEDMLVDGFGYGRTDVDQEARLTEALGLDPANVLARVGLAFSRVEHGDHQAAFALLDGAPAPAPALQRARAVVERRAGVGDGAAALAGEPADLIDAFILGKILYEGIEGVNGSVASDPEAALPHFTRAVLESPRPRELFHIARLRAAFGADRKEAAMEQAKACVNLWPDSPYAHYFAGLAYSQDTERMTAHYERTVEIDPGFHLAHTSLAVIHTVSGRKEQAEASFANAVEHAPSPESRARALFFHAKYGAADDPERALELIDRGLAEHPSSSELQALHAEVLDKVEQ